MTAPAENNFYFDPADVWAKVSLEDFEDVDLKFPRVVCLQCNESLTSSWLYRQLRVCPHCRFHYSVSPTRRVASLVDTGTFRETDVWIESQPALDLTSEEDYAQVLEENVIRTGLKEAVVTGICEIGSVRAALMILDFGFLGGGVGVVAGQKITRILDKATQRKMPCVAVLSSSGRREQEGLYSLIQTAKIMQAVQNLKKRKVPLISITCNPAFGQIVTSLIMQSDIVLAEPGTRIGITSPKPSQVQDLSAEAFFEAGQIDRISDRELLKHEVESILNVLKPRKRKVERDQPPPPKPEDDSPHVAENYFDIARNPERPDARWYVDKIFLNFLELYGDRLSGDDLTVISGLGMLGDIPVAVIAQRETKSPLNPSGFNKAQRMVELASKMKVPVVSFVDNCGFTDDSKPETKGLASAMSRMIAAMLTAETPIVSVILQESGGDYDLAFNLSDKILIFENAFLTHTRTANEESSSTAERESEENVLRHLTSVQAKQSGFADVVVPEPEGGAHSMPEDTAIRLKTILMGTVSELLSDKSKSYLKDRLNRYDRDFIKGRGKLRGTIRNEFNAWRAGIRTGARILRGEGDEKAEPENPKETRITSP